MAIPSAKKKDKETLQFERKYRPSTLDDFVGNRVTKTHLLNLSKKDDVPHTILFEGPPGCGKTSLARLLAKEISCREKNEEGSACGVCPTCVAITTKLIEFGDQAQGIPVYEINMTTKGGKDDIVQLVEEMKTRSIGNAKKVYILDEVQRVSKEGQNSLLKISEEPNEWLYIFLCTTDPDDLIPALKSRYRHMRIRKPTMPEIKERLAYICQRESIPYHDSALTLIANARNRTPRDCIISLESIAKGGDVTFDRAVENLQVVSSKVYIEFITSISGGDISEVLNFIEGLDDTYGIEYEDFLKNLSSFAIDAFNMTMQVGIEKYTEEIYKETRKAFKGFKTREMIFFLSLIEEALKNRFNSKYALTMLALKFGFPNYFKPLNGDEIKEELKREDSSSKMAYMNVNRALQDEKINALVDNELDASAVTNIFDGGYEVNASDIASLFDINKNEEDSE